MIHSYLAYEPLIAASAWIADSAEVIGKVVIQADASVWFQSVVRGDSDEIFIGAESNIQDGCILHTDPQHILQIEERVTIGHGCILHGCRIESECLIGMGAIILNGAHIHQHSIIGAGAVVTENMVIPERSLVVGCPARVIRQVSEQQITDIQSNAAHYCALARAYQKEE